MHWLDMERDLGLEAPAFRRARPLDVFRNALSFRKRALAAAVVAAALAVLVVLIAAPLEYRASARIAVERPVAAESAFPLWPEIRLIGSRDLGRRAAAALRLDARPEFYGGAEPLRPALVFLGLTPDPPSVSPAERVLRAYEERLSVRALEPGRLEITFRSRNPSFAAAAANTIAALYLATRAEAGLVEGGRPAAMIVSPAVKPARPILPPARLLAAVAAGAGLLAALASGALGRASFRPETGEPVEPPRAIGEAPVFVRLRDVRRQVPQAGQTAASRRAAADDAEALDGVAARILSARRDGRALRIAGAELSQGDAASGLILTLARRLGAEGRSILVSLGDADAGRAGAAPGLRDLLAATASFDEAIRRDPRSRLHLISGGRGEGPIELAGLDAVLDALAGAYDFIWLAAPPVDADDTARTLAAGADFFVLAAPPQPRGGAVAQAAAELRVCGARDILVLGAPLPAQGRFGQDAA